MLSYLKIKKLPKFNISKKYYSSPVSLHCTYCGTQFSTTTYPKLCNCCNNTTFRNPIPVAVGLLPFETIHGTGLLLIERAIKPFIGGLCFPGGFVDWNESWREAISREIFEETTVATDPQEFSIFNIESTPDNTRILIFGLSNRIRTINELATYTKTNETSGISIGLETNNKLCFSLHQNVYDQWFIKNNKLE